MDSRKYTEYEPYVESIQPLSLITFCPMNCSPKRLVFNFIESAPETNPFPSISQYKPVIFPVFIDELL